MNLCVQGKTKMYTPVNISLCSFETCVVPVLLRYPLTYPKYFHTTEMHYWLEDLLLLRFSFWIGLSLCAFRNSVVRVYFLFCMKLWALHKRVEADPATCRREEERERSWDRRSLKKKSKCEKWKGKNRVEDWVCVCVCVGERRLTKTRPLAPGVSWIAKYSITQN